MLPIEILWISFVNMNKHTCRCADVLVLKTVNLTFPSLIQNISNVSKSRSDIRGQVEKEKLSLNVLSAIKFLQLFQ